MTTSPAASSAVVQPRKWRRTHGLQLPLHPQQAASWVFLLFFALFNFGVLLPAMHSSIYFYLVQIDYRLQLQSNPRFKVIIVSSTLEKCKYFILYAIAMVSCVFSWLSTSFSTSPISSPTFYRSSSTPPTRTCARLTRPAPCPSLTAQSTVTSLRTDTATCATSTSRASARSTALPAISALTCLTTTASGSTSASARGTMPSFSQVSRPASLWPRHSLGSVSPWRRCTRPTRRSCSHRGRTWRQVSSSGLTCPTQTSPPT
jgi:hypothetical protein